ncbi:MAG: hypothetical protein WBQ05_01645 [Candidatus Competibacter denitrificans]
MRLTCPCCGAAHSLEGLLADQSAREAVIAALGLPGTLGERLVRYVSLFRPRERALSWERAARLLSELNATVHAGQIERDGRVYPAPLDYWKVAIDQMLDNRDKLILPLKNHGYLFKIIGGLSQKADDKRAARQEIDDERAKAREGDRQGQMVQAVSLVEPAHPVITTPDGAQLNEETGEILTERRPTRTPPPPEFRALLAKLKGKMTCDDSNPST